MEMDQQQDDKALRRIIQMLIALAVLAERASGRSLPVRWLVFWILRPAEAFAQAFVCDVAQEQFLFIADSGLLDDDGSPQLIGLAMRLRALAAALELALLIIQPQRFTAEIRRSIGAMRPVVRHLNTKAPVGLPGSRAPPPHLREDGQAPLQSRTGCLERFGAPVPAPETVASRPAAPPSSS